MSGIGLGVARGRIDGKAVIRDKDGNIKGELTIGGDATLEQAAALAGITPEQLQSKLNASQETPHGRDSDNRSS